MAAAAAATSIYFQPSRVDDKSATTNWTYKYAYYCNAGAFLFFRRSSLRGRVTARPGVLSTCTRFRETSAGKDGLLCTTTVGRFSGLTYANVPPPPSDNWHAVVLCETTKGIDGRESASYLLVPDGNLRFCFSFQRRNVVSPPLSRIQLMSFLEIRGRRRNMKNR